MKHCPKQDLKQYTHMLLSVRQNFPQSGKKLDPCLFGQCCGNVTQLHESTEQRPCLQTEMRLVWLGAGRCKNPATRSPMRPCPADSTSPHCSRHPSTFKLSKI